MNKILEEYFVSTYILGE